MKLTNKMRDEFVYNVISKVKIKCPYNKDYICKEVRRRIDATAPKIIQDTYAAYPGAITSHSYYVTWLVEKKLDSQGRSYHTNATVYHLPFADDPKGINFDDLKEGWEKYKLEEKKRDELKARVKEIAYACTTVEKLVQAVPEFKKYMPKCQVEPKKNLPATVANIVTDLMAAGVKFDE